MPGGHDVPKAAAYRGAVRARLNQVLLAAGNGGLPGVGLNLIALAAPYRRDARVTLNLVCVAAGNGGRPGVGLNLVFAAAANSRVPAAIALEVTSANYGVVRPAADRV